jgi:hypothetical protein
MVKGFTVAIDHDVSDETSARIADAIRMIGGVVSVQPSASTSEDWMNREQIRHEMFMLVMKALRP